MSKYTLRLKGDRQQYWVYKISMGQNTDEGIGFWSQMASERFLSLSESELDWAISCLSNFADIAHDDGQRSDEKSATRLMESLMTLKTVR
jgi:hypothetical protein